MRLVTWITLGLLSASLQAAPGRMLRANEVDKEPSRNAKGDVIGVGNTGLSLVLGEKPSPAEKRATELLAERLKDRAGIALAGLQDKDALRLVIGTSTSNDEIKTFLTTRKEVAALGQDGYVIAVEPGKRDLFIAGQSDSGVVAGVGRLMREVRYLSGKIEVPALHIAETPQMPNRGIYLWARKFYFDQPDRLDRYIEELALWGCNGIAFWFEMGMFDTFDTLGTGPDLASQHGNKLPPQEWLKMYRRFYATARRMGMKTGLLMVANDAYRTSPAEMRIEPIIGCPTCYLCPSKPGAVEKMVAWQEQVFKALAPIDICNIFPADAGGCSCRDCTPWPTKGLWTIARPLAERIHQISPETEIWLDTWHLNHPTFGGKDWKNLVDDVSNDPPAWLAGFEVGLAPHHRFAAMSAEERDHYNQAKQPLMVFPDISMWGNHKGMLVNQAYWKELQNELNDYDPKLMQGGWPYTERWNTDIANVVFLSWFSNPKKNVETILDEYASFYFGSDAASGRELIELLDDSNKDPNRKQKIQETFAKLDASVPEWVKRDWRWNEISASASRFGVAPQAPAKPREPDTAAKPPTPQRSLPVELPHQEQNAIKTSWPAIGCWFPQDQHFKPDGYKQFLELHAKHSPFSLLTTSIRCKGWMTDPRVHDQMKAAAEYARDLGMGIVLELDWPFARSAWVEKYPDELQGVVRICQAPLTTTGAVELARTPPNAGYFWDSTGYVALSSRVVRVWSYRTTPEGPEAVEDITARAKVVQADARGVKVTIPCTAADEGRVACLMALFNMHHPDMFSPHLITFERDVLRQYADVPLAGVCKDEAGFIPPEKISLGEDLWYSPFMAKAYAARRPGHQLERDLLLMSRGEKDRSAERTAAVNHYMELFWQRNAEIETEYYHSIKTVFGQQAMVGTHPTWQPHPNRGEVTRNGLHWWGAKRDLAQTDETCPYGVRTALAKKWNSPLWYNMYYAGNEQPYAAELWANVLAGGRINWHPLWPCDLAKLDVSLLSVADKLFRADCRIRLLNYISTRPVDCPVAVIFSHPRACNWSVGSWGDSGWQLCDQLWQAGIYADLIPSSEIASGALTIAADGRLQYGPQKYALAVFYQPEYERPAAGAFFRHASAAGQTALYRVGNWTTDFDGNPVNVQTMLPAAMKELTGDTVAAIVSHLKAAGIEPQTQGNWHQRLSGQCRLLDGTVILASGEIDVLGDLIQRTIQIGGQDVSFDAVGVAAARLDQAGKLEALACGGLKSFRGGGVTIELPERIDLALWRDDKGQWRGVLQDYAGPVPNDLAALTGDWNRLAVPTRLDDEGARND